MRAVPWCNTERKNLSRRQNQPDSVTDSVWRARGEMCHRPLPGLWLPGWSRRVLFWRVRPDLGRKIKGFL